VEDVARPSDLWSGAEAYQQYMGRWSRPVAARFLDWLAPAPGRRWLDVGSGTGALSETILARCAPAAVLGVEPSPAFVAHATNAVRDSRASFRLGDAQHVPVQDASFDVVVSGLVLNFVSDPAAALAEMSRVARPGGVIGAYVWDYAGGMQMTRFFWDAAVDQNPAAEAQDEGRLFPVCRPEPLARLFGDAGLDDVRATAIDVATRFTGFDDFWRPFLAGVGPAPAYAMSLDDAARSALRERLRNRLPAGADGSIPLLARAWAVRGRVS
jgi:SAM-dependent methyltransferase